jgi:hypothetical protein
LVADARHGYLGEILSVARCALAPKRGCAYHFSVRLTASHLLGLLLLVSACATAEGPNETVATTTHALLRVDRSAQVGSESQATGVAFAGVVRVPELADPELLLRLSGKGPTLPALGQCSTTSHERDALPTGDLGHAEFLSAGDVVLGTAEVETLLAPRAFPILPAEPLSGVVYTSRDRASAPPGGALYLLKTSGSEQLPGLELRVQAPDELTDVTVGGVAFAGLQPLDSSTELVVSWRPGDARDVVYVEVTGAASSGSLGLCAFRDADGRGTLPRGLFGATGAGSLALHRLREVAADVPALDGAEVRFDFALTAEVAFR